MAPNQSAILKAMREKEGKWIVTGKDLKRIIASNIPFEFGLIESDIHDYLTIKASEVDINLEIREIAIN